ncbi:Protein SCAR4 [Hibiscus syriacus]|uniref:Protein SCAR n=1 Tax=Hibiscus syriacus TaxID=106335 RepID=A0A6A3A0Z2_HIBSY|nr:protein SCAR2-like isoform X2 [Hibiscus syriacus]KAE8697683.1 Protein SCAR4 [Hibiscus syriacus]
MPLTRYQIKNEFSLADPELYRATEKDDPEALLEGVSMSGLVGVLRLLGDLAEFAAEIFHHLHEEVTTTAARGHVLMARVEQLEAEFPSDEKAFLSKTSQSLFFTNAGVEWLPNLRTEHNLITRGDLPRCVLDSYEECRAPPRLFLLDKFDIAGAGACLKRYTDPSFFKAEPAFTGIAPLEFPREKKAHKVKKKGSRWKNGETPEFPQTSHAKFHNLFLEEHIENAYNDPARLVKLKRRQLNESPLDSKSGRSYLEKFLETPAQKKVAVYENSGTLPLRLTLDNSSGSGPETLDISTASPVNVSSQGKETLSSEPTVHEIVLKPSIEELNEEVIDTDVMKVPETTVDIKDGIPLSLHKVTTEEEIIVDREGMEDYNVYADHSDDVTSEADNIDAITTMESEMDTDNEYKLKNGIDFEIIGKYQTGSHAKEEKLGAQDYSSYYQSDWISSASDDGNCSIKKRSGFTNSDTIHNLAKDMASDGEIAEEVVPSNRNFVTEIVQAPPIQLPTCLEMQCPSSDQILLQKDSSFGEHCLPDLGEASYSLCLEDLNSTHILLDEVSPLAIPLLEPQHEEVASDGKSNSNLSDSDCGQCLNDSSEVIFSYSSEKQVSPLKGSDNDHLDEVLETDFAGEICAGNSVNQTIGSPNCIISSTEEQGLCSTFTEGEECITPVVDASQICGFNEHQFSDILHHGPEVEASLTEREASYSEQKQNVVEISDATEGEETMGFTCSANEVEDVIRCDLPYDFSDNLNLKNLEDLDDLATENVHAGSIAVSAAAYNSAYFGNDVDDTIYHSSNLICPPSGKQMDLEVFLAGDRDMCHEGLESNEVVSQECLTELETEEATNQVVGTPADVDSTSCKSVSYTNSNLEDTVHYATLAEPTKDSLNFIDLATAPASSEFSDKESELEHSSHLKECKEDMVPSTTHYQSEKENSLVLPLDIHDNQHDVEKLYIAEDGSRQIQSPDPMDQEICLQSSFEHSKEGSSTDPSFDFTEQSGRRDKQERYPSDLIHHAFGLHPEATEYVIEEMPPLPPLPPMQWRTGRVQYGEKAQLGLPAPEQGFEQHRNPFLPLVPGEERSGDSDQLPIPPTDATCRHIPVSLHEETSHRPNQFVLDASLEGGAFQNPKQSFDREHGNPLVVSACLPTKREEPIPTKVEQFTTKVDEQPRHGLAASEAEKVQTPNVIVQHGLAAPEGESTLIEHDLSTSEGETAWPSNTHALVQVAEEENSNGNSPVKLPRPRSPLIDDVSAHDKSKMRKVTEQNRPSIIPKVDERDSLLEQIRTKSFNLKPAVVVTRPRVEGPKTNIRVAAILEKANAIRQALAGSNEDDDEDGWSDS